MPKWDSERARDNLLSLSKEQTDFNGAVAEWYWTGDFIDYGIRVETCQLCQHTGLRYHFKILNTQTDSSLLVGSECILRFNIAVYGDDGQLLEGKTKQKKLKDKIREAHIEQALKPLRELWVRVDKKNKNFIKFLAERVKEGRGLSPQDLLIVFQLMKEYDIEFDHNLYKVAFSPTNKRELLQMPETDLQLIWDCLTDKQKETYQKLKAAVKEPAERQEKITADSFQKMQLKQKVALFQETDHLSVTKVDSAPKPKDDICLPLKYNERSHRYTIIFRDRGGHLLTNPVFRGDLEFCKKYVEEQIVKYPAGTKVEVLVTTTKEIVYHSDLNSIK